MDIQPVGCFLPHTKQTFLSTVSPPHTVFYLLFYTIFRDVYKRQIQVNHVALLIGEHIAVKVQQHRDLQVLRQPKRPLACKENCFTGSYYTRFFSPCQGFFFTPVPLFLHFLWVSGFHRNALLPSAIKRPMTGRRIKHSPRRSKTGACARNEANAIL